MLSAKNRGSFRNRNPRSTVRAWSWYCLVQAIPHRGHIVPKPDLEAIREIYELREVLEGLAARLATLLAWPDRLGSRNPRAGAYPLQSRSITAPRGAAKTPSPTGKVSPPG
ncbi:hypothetical protein TthHC11_20380 (plasmid) [Thermus thermophilus]|nr:hypothetical protein TthHC11_20380 [Thermus thermophilus]